MLKKIALATALLASLGTAHAYQAELGGTIAIIDPDNGDTSTGFGVDGTYYFDSVHLKNDPYNEAAFLNRASNLNASLSYVDYDGYENTTLNAGIEYFVPNSDFYISGNLGQMSEETEGFEDFDTTLYSAELGYLPVPGLLLAVGLAGYDNDMDDGIDPTVRAKYVTRVGQYDMNFEAGANFGDLDAYTLGTDLYLDNTFSLGLGFADSDVKDSDVFSIRAKKFLNQQVSLEGSIHFADAGNVFAVRGAYRF